MHHARRRPEHPVWRGVGLVLVAALAAGGSAVAAVVHGWDSKIRRSDGMALAVQTKKPGEPVDAATGALNILLLGSDSRDGENEAIGGADGGMRSDTMIVMHVSADRKRVELVSIPRDSLVDVPSCLMADGSTTRPRPATMINSAFSIGWLNGGTTDKDRLDSAIGCAVSTVYENTGLTIRHSVVVDFVGFQAMVDTLGGVEVCIEQDMRDPGYTGLDLKAGYQHLDGTQALQLARTRHAYASGMDTSRIGGQQQLLAAMADKVMSKDLTDAPQLLSFVSQVAGSLVVDRTLDPGSLVWALRSIRSDDVVFTTIPWQLSPQNPNRVVWTSQADDVWAAMAADTPVRDALSPAGQTGPAPGQTTSPAPDETAPPGPASALPKQATSVADQVRRATVCPA